MTNKELSTSLAPSLLKLGACFIYDALIVTALSFAFAGLFVWIVGDSTHGLKRYLLQFALWIFIGVYFTWCWTKSGQTLAMKTWKLKLVYMNGDLLVRKIAALRYLGASIGLMLFGLGFLWAIIDPDRLYLHDRLLKNKITVVPRNTAS